MRHKDNDEVTLFEKYGTTFNIVTNIEKNTFFFLENVYETSKKRFIRP